MNKKSIKIEELGVIAMVKASFRKYVLAFVGLIFATTLLSTIPADAVSTSGPSLIPMVGSSIRITETWGDGYHGQPAIDFAGSGNVYAAGSGRVETVFTTTWHCHPGSNLERFDACAAAAAGRGLGSYVIIRHGDGTRSVYGHLSGTGLVSQGANVDGGQRIGSVALTGITTGLHLHYEERNAAGTKIDPGNQLACHGATIVGYDGWTGRQYTNIRNDGYSCHATQNPVVPSGNLLVNPGMEQDNTGWGVLHRPSGATVNRSVYGEQPARSHSGTHFLEANTNRVGGSVGQDVRVGLAAGQTYTYSVWVRHPYASTVQLDATIALWALGGTQESASKAVKVTNRWQRVDVPLTLARGGHHTLRAEHYMRTTGRNFNFDDANLRRTTARVPSMPATPTCVADNAGRVTFRWSAPATNGAPLSNYSIRVRRVGGSPTAWWGRATSIRSQTYTTFPVGVGHQLQVRASNSVGNSTASSWSAACTPVKPPSRPSAPGCAVAGNGALVLTVQEPAVNGSAVVEYQTRLQVNGSNLAWTSVGAKAGLVRTAPQAPGAYQVAVRARNAAGWSTASPLSTTCTVKPPVNPIVTNAAQSGSTDARFTGNGRGFTPNAIVDLTATLPNGNAYPAGSFGATIRTNSTGGFSWVWEFGAQPASGVHVLTFVDRTTGKSAVARLTSTFVPVVDLDGDGVADGQDRCPTVRGPAANDGCPVDGPDDRTVFCDGRVATIVGTAGNDTLTGTPGPDVIAALQGDDIVWGLDGDDVICGGQGDDTIYGGQGFDILFGAQGEDIIYAASGSSGAGLTDSRGARMFGGAGDDQIFGSDRWDRMQGGPGFDTLNGFAGNDWMRGGPQADSIDGGTGSDDIGGGPGNDDITVEGGRNTLNGGPGNDDCAVSVNPRRIRSCEERN